MPKPPSVEETLTEAIEQLVLERINGYGECESTAVQAAFQRFDTAMNRLKATLTPEQHQLLIDCENAISEVDGETMNYYYRAGFADAVTLMNGGQKDDNQD
ncbi:MAG: hypothetical protein IKU57_01875 [Oscillospiraceae bacterium]|nr:hypothetical protein [Oscillospiraceae bacterium]